MVRGPDASDTLIDTRNGLFGALQLLPAGFLEQVRLLQYLFRLEIPNTDGLLASINVVSSDHWVLVRPRRDSDFDLRVCSGEGRKSALQEGTAG